LTNSILLTIYDDLEAMSVTYVDKSAASINPNCFNLDEIPSSVQTAQLPCRILLPIGQGQGGTPTAQILRGAGVQAQWTITDLFLCETAQRDAGIYILAPVLMRYVVAYAEALGKQFQFLHGWNVESLTISSSIVPGMYEYPAGSGTWFYGVKCDVTIEEIF
jgi:hypothetical protein